MALPPLATVDDLSEWMGVDIADEVRAEAILSAASTLVRTHTGRTWVDADGEPEETATALELDTVKTVVTLVAERVWSNPRGFVQQATGPFSGTVAEWSAYGLALTDSEREMLPTGTSKPALWTLATTRADLVGDLPDIYLDVVESEKIPHVPVGEVNW